jgi:hypothetical protein
MVRPGAAIAQDGGQPACPFIEFAVCPRSHASGFVGDDESHLVRRRPRLFAYPLCHNAGT